jgi:hypothetical protein
VTPRRVSLVVSALDSRPIRSGFKSRVLPRGPIYKILGQLTGVHPSGVGELILAPAGGYIIYAAAGQRVA